MGIPVYRQLVRSTSDNLGLQSAPEVQGGGLWNLQSVVSQSKAQGTTWACDWGLREGAEGTVL